MRWEKQLGLKLELLQVPIPVILVDSVNRKPTENTPDVAEVLPRPKAPTDFEVASIKPTAPDFTGERAEYRAEWPSGVAGSHDG